MRGFAPEVSIELLMRAGVTNVASMGAWRLFTATDATYDFLREKKALDTTSPSYPADAIALVQQLTPSERSELQQRIAK